MIAENEVEDFLEHHGVKGQKWGRRKDRSNHGFNQRARKLQAVADRRPTRGNVRKAERAQKASKYFVRMTPAEKEKFHNSPTARKARHDTKVYLGKVGVSIGAGVASGVIVGKLVRKHASLPVAKIAASVTSYAGTSIALHILDANGKRKLKSLNSKRGK